MAFNLAPLLACALLGKAKHLGQRVVVQLILQAARLVLRIHARIGRLPGRAVIALPFLLERRAPPRVRPVLRLFHIDGLHARIHRRGHTLLDVLHIRGRGHVVPHVHSMHPQLARRRRLNFVPLKGFPLAIVIAIPAPRYPRHHGHAIALRPPPRNTLRKIPLRAIHNCHVRSDIHARRIRRGCLEVGGIGRRGKGEGKER